MNPSFHFRYFAAALLAGVLCLTAQARAASETPEPGQVLAGDAIPGWEVERYYLPDAGVREGEMIISMSADIDGDGIAERLVTTNYQRNGKSGNMWTVYDVVDGRMRELGDLQFDSDNCGIFVERGFDASPRLYAFLHKKDSTDLVAFSISGGKAVTETAKEGVDFAEYSEMMKNSRPEIRTRDAAQLYNLYTREYVDQLKMTEAESRTIKTRIKDRPANANARHVTSDAGSPASEKITGNIWYVIALCVPALLGVFLYLYKRSA